MINQILESFLLIFFAEIGDKTQVLALTFAIKYSIKNVLIGIVIGSSISHILAVIIGIYLSSLVSASLIGIISGIVFIFFGLYSLKYEEEEEDENSKERIHPIITVAVAFFIGELGDKTQLATMVLAAQANYPYLIPLGSVLAMTITGFIGIIVGKKIGDKIPELAVKLISSFVFIVFGLIKVYEMDMVNNKFLFIIIIILMVVFIIIFKNTKNKYKANNSKLKLRSKFIHEYFKEMQVNIENICLGTGQCITCDTNKCVIGNTKEIINIREDQKKIEELKNNYEINSLYKNFNVDEIENTVKIIDVMLNKYPNSKEAKVLKIIRQNLENIKKENKNYSS